ncbi:hypothetical protein ACFLUB_00310 [Chloroflexota bacterium]
MSDKLVGKRAEPTTEELEFISERIPQLSDSEILEDMQDTEFPVRSIGFIKRRRREFNAVKKALEIETKQQMNPYIVKAVDEHHAKIREMIEKLLENLPMEVPLFEYQYDKDKKLWLYFGPNRTPTYYNAVVSQPFFKVVREHLQSEYPWEKHSDFENKWGEIVNTCEKVRDKIKELKKSAETWPDVINIGDSFEKIIGYKITERQFGTNALSTIHFSIRGNWLEACHKFPDEDYSDKYSILQSKYPESFIETYKSQIDSILNMKETARIITLSIEVIDILYDLGEALQDILINHTWVTTTCKWCPGQSTSSL